MFNNFYFSYSKRERGHFFRNDVLLLEKSSYRIPGGFELKVKVLFICILKKENCLLIFEKEERRQNFLKYFETLQKKFERK